MKTAKKEKGIYTYFKIAKIIKQNVLYFLNVCINTTKMYRDNDEENDW